MNKENLLEAALKKTGINKRFHLKGDDYRYLIIKEAKPEITPKQAADLMETNVANVYSARKRLKEVNLI
jgi:hypothetical protein